MVLTSDDAVVQAVGAEPLATCLLRVLCDPVSYYGPWQRRLPQLGPQQRTALNAWLIHRHALPAYREPTAAESGLTRRFLLGWERIPVVAHLMACAKQRRHLTGSRLYLTQPAHVHAFLRLPFIPACEEVPVQCDADLQAWGGRYLLHGLRERLPHWLQARMALQLDIDPASMMTGAEGTEALDLNCFWSAWNHAAYLP